MYHAYSVPIRLGAAALLATALYAAEPAAPRLPLPGWRIPAPPRICPSVVTAGGQRLLLAQTDVRLWWDSKKHRLACNRPGWWITNYPLSQVAGLEGLTPDQLARKVIGTPAASVKNWYVRVPGQPGPEPAAPAGPASIELSGKPTLVVDPSHPKAADANPGTTAAPLKTIQAALDKAAEGSIIRVMPGIYRESIVVKRGGRRGLPVVIDGVRDSAGQMPVITGNDPFPANAWKPVADAPGVYRADIFTGRPGTVSVNGKALIERSYCQDLKPGEYCLNLASREANSFRVPADVSPEAGETVAGLRWVQVQADEDGFLDPGRTPGGIAANSVYYAFAYVWVEPKKVSETWDPRFPQPITKRVDVPGDFRAGRQTGSSLKGQLNFYRVWCNGQRVESVVYMTPADKTVPPRPSRNYGQEGDRIESFAMKQGWNRLMFQLDTTRRPKRTRFKFCAPKGVDQFVSSTRRPEADVPPRDAKPAPYVSEYLVLGPFRSEPDNGVYVRLDGDRDPNGVLMDLSARGSELVMCEQDYVHFRGFEVRHGAQFQQRAQVVVKGCGCLVEGCLIRDSEVSGLSVANPHDQQADATIVRNNWIVNTGHTGMGAQHTSTQLTPGNQTDTAPGRGRLIIEHNVIRMTNWAAHPPFWASGGMKLFRLTGCVIRYNRIEHCFGPGIWLDWEHYNNRLEGNLIYDNWSFGIGIEASPGPNLVANNLMVGMRPGYVWFRWNILDWSTARTVAVHNTIDGKWCPLPCWFNRKGTDGIFIGQEGGPDRRTVWEPIGERGASGARGAVAMNNLILGCTQALHKRTAEGSAGNYSHRGRNAQPLAEPPALVAASPLDYRVRPQEPLATQGVLNEHTLSVKHDFYGLLRLDPATRAVGAFRREPVRAAGDEPTIEVELTDGTILGQRPRH